MVTGHGFWASPWLVPAALMVICAVVIAGFTYLMWMLGFIGGGRVADEADLRAARRWFDEVREQRYEDSAAGWTAFLEEERGRLAAAVADVDVDVDPDPAPELDPYVIEALNGHGSVDEELDSIFTRHGVQ